MGQNANTSGGSSKKTPLTLRQGQATSASGYMVASGEGNGAMACNIDGVIVEGNYQGSEGDPCSAEISVK